MINFNDKKVRLMLGDKIVKSGYLGNVKVYSSFDVKKLLSHYNVGAALIGNNCFELKSGNLIKASGLTGEILDICGYPGSSGLLIATTEGVFFWDSSITAKKISGITGNIVSIAGAPSSFAVVTTNGLFIASAYEYKINNLKKATGLSGSILRVVGGSPGSISGGCLVHTTEGIFLAAPYDVYYSSIKITKITGVTGNVLEMYSESPMNRNYQNVILTSDGVFLLKGDSSIAYKIQGLIGNIISITPSDAEVESGIGIATTEGFFLASYSQRTAIKVNEITGNIISVKGRMPKSDQQGAVVATTDGLFLVDGYRNKVIKVSGLEGDILMIDGYSPINSYDHTPVVTTTGVFIVNNIGVSTKINGIYGEVLKISSYRGTENVFVITTEGIFLIKNGVVEKISDITDDMI